MKRYGFMFGLPKRRKKVAFFDTEFDRNLEAGAYKKAGFRVRKLTRKPAKQKRDWI